MKTTMEQNENSFYLFGRKFVKDADYNDISLFSNQWKYSSIDDVRKYYRKIYDICKLKNFDGDILNQNSYMIFKLDYKWCTIYAPRAINGDKEWTRYKKIEIKIQVDNEK